MEIKCIEIRDEGTCIPVLAIKMSPDSPIQRAYLSRTGFGSDPYLITVMMLNTLKATYSPYDWGVSRTMTNAHSYILENFEKLVDGQVVDVRVILGEKENACEPEIWTGGL